jgi:hypothetical protein
MDGRMDGRMDGWMDGYKSGIIWGSFFRVALYMFCMLLVAFAWA